MAKIRLENNFYVAREDGTPGPWKLAKQFTAENALQLSAELRSRGIRAEAIQNSGGESIEPRAEVAPAESQSYSWRGIVPKRITATMWGYVWRDAIDDVTHSVTGVNSEDVLRKIQTIEHPVYQRLRDSLPPENPATAPVFNQPVPAGPSGANGRVLRPGSATYSQPERRIEAAPVVREDFAVWEKTATAKQFQERCKNDSAFLAWANQVSQ